VPSRGSALARLRDLGCALTDRPSQLGLGTRSRLISATASGAEVRCIVSKPRFRLADQAPCSTSTSRRSTEAVVPRLMRQRHVFETKIAAAPLSWTQCLPVVQTERTDTDS